MRLFNTIVLSHVNTGVLGFYKKTGFNQFMKFRERLILARKTAKLSQEELALKIGCSQGLISKLERGDQEETGLIVKIAKATGVNPFWLDSGDGDMITGNFKYNKEMEMHLKVMQQLPDYARTEVIRDAIKTAELITKAKADTKTNGTIQ